jgi:hypothetical protein
MKKTEPNYASYPIADSFKNNNFIGTATVYDRGRYIQLTGNQRFILNAGRTFSNIEQLIQAVKRAFLNRQRI